MCVGVWVWVWVWVCVCVEVEGGTFPHHHQAILRTPAECHTIQLHSSTLTTCTQYQIPQDKSWVLQNHTPPHHSRPQLQGQAITCASDQLAVGGKGPKLLCFQRGLLFPTIQRFTNPGVGDRQGGPACCDWWAHKESDMTEWLNWTEQLFSSIISP